LGVDSARYGNSLRVLIKSGTGESARECLNLALTTLREASLHPDGGGLVGDEAAVLIGVAEIDQALHVLAQAGVIATVS
jgi:hypothetical protein